VKNVEKIAAFAIFLREKYNIGKLSDTSLIYDITECFPDISFDEANKAVTKIIVGMSKK
jgi:hypothetical protein